MALARVTLMTTSPLCGARRRRTIGRADRLCRDGRTLFFSIGERQQFTSAQRPTGTLGKIVRLYLDGSGAAGNPFASGSKPEIWTLGHSNPYGLVFASDGWLFESEMGPAGGDEFNLIQPGKHYGWPKVSEGDNYDGTRHSTNTAYTALAPDERAGRHDPVSRKCFRRMEEGPNGSL